MVGFSTIFLLIGGITGWYSVMSDNRLPLGAFHESIFYFLVFPATTFMAASYIPLESLVKNLKTILVRGVGFTLLSFLIVSTGAAYLLPKLFGFSSLRLTDYLFVGAIFGSSNLFFTFEDICYSCTNMRMQLEIATAEGVFSALTTQLLLSLIKALNSATFSWDFVLRGATKITTSLIISPLIISPLIGLWFGLSHSRQLLIRKTKQQDLPDSEIRTYIFFTTFLIYLLNEWFYLNGILAAFVCGVIMSRDHLPKIPKYVTSPWSFGELTFLLRIVRDWFLHYWVACSLTDLQWQLITSSSETYKTFVGVWTILLILLIMGRLPSVYHLSRFVDPGLEKDCEDAFFEGRGPEHVYPCTSADLDRLLKTATSARNVQWFSRFMPSSIALVAALSQFGESTGEGQAFLLAGITHVVYFTNLVYCVLVHWVL